MTIRPFLAPVALFAYRRAEMLGAVLDSLEACPEFARTPVYVFSDGPKHDGARSDVSAVRAMVRSRLRPNMRLIESLENLGLGNSISNGATKLCNEFGRVIVIEDDLLVSPDILTWFNNALDAFADEESVMQISGHLFRGLEADDNTGFFLPLTTSWGWATWKRAWDRYDPGAEGSDALLTDNGLRRKFDLDGAYPYAKMLERQKAGKVDSWAIRWYWTVFQSRGLVLFPPRSLVVNEGKDGVGTHTSTLGRLRAALRRRRPLVKSDDVPRNPNSVFLSPTKVDAMKRAIGRQ